MKKLKKRIGYFLFVILFILSLCGCSNSSNQENNYDDIEDITIDRYQGHIGVTDECNILTYNGYEVVDIQKTFNEEAKEYIIIVKLKNIMNKVEKGD